MRLAACFRRQQAHPGRIAEQQDAAQVVADHRHAERQPEPIEDEEHAEGDGGDDGGVAGDGGEALTQAVEETSVHERRGRIGERQA